jgi:probable aminopeptidase NPEPL1
VGALPQYEVSTADADAMSSNKRARVEGATRIADDARSTSELLKFEAPSSTPAAAWILVGRKAALLELSPELLPAGVSVEVFKFLVGKTTPGDTGKSASTVFTTPAGGMAMLVAAALPDVCSRHNSPIRPHSITALVGPAARDAAKEAGGAAVILVLDDPSHAAGAACAVARAFPTYTMKNPRQPAVQGSVRVGFATRTAALPDAPYGPCAAAAAAVRLAARLVDTPPEQLTTTAFLGEAKQVVERLHALGREVTVEVIVGEELLRRGYGGIHGVGRAATEPPALCVLSHVPSRPTKTVCLVGKGIVYDTGGLALKGREGMCGMKADMGGAAGLMGGFEAAVAIGTGSTALHCILCLAENAIGPTAFRNDDVLTFFSGRTCEVNNTDAEGRLVLADGVAHATARPSLLPGKAAPDLVVDMATLTGAQMIATGKNFAAIFTNDEATELAAVAAGRRTGDLVHPLPYAPEFHRAEFESKIADCKNSVKNRNNAQSSCAGNFIRENLHPDYEGAYLHVDMAGPAFIEDRATGYGVALVLGLLEVEGFGVPPRE